MICDVKKKLFQQLAIGAAYTPASLGPDGKIYSQNDGHLYVVGNTTAQARNSATVFKIAAANR